MLEKRFYKENKIDEKKREQIIRRIKDYFLDKDDVVFAYLHGSFIESRSFKDIDIAILVKNPVHEIELESDLSYELTDKTGYPVEVRIINNASIAFQMAVLRKGRLLVSKTDNVRTDFIETTSRRYREYSHFRNLILAA
jgi:hypothetical protein